MGMYTEVYISADLRSDMPEDKKDVLRAMCSGDWAFMEDNQLPLRWSMLFGSGSCYTSDTQCSEFNEERMSLIGKGDIKNYDDEIAKFFDFIIPWCEDGDTFIGYYRYEECRNYAQANGSACQKGSN